MTWEGIRRLAARCADARHRLVATVFLAIAFVGMVLVGSYYDIDTVSLFPSLSALSMAAIWTDPFRDVQTRVFDRTCVFTFKEISMMFLVDGVQPRSFARGFEPKGPAARLIARADAFSGGPGYSARVTVPQSFSATLEALDAKIWIRPYAVVRPSPGMRRRMDVFDLIGLRIVQIDVIAREPSHVDLIYFSAYASGFAINVE